MSFPDPSPIVGLGGFTIPFVGDALPDIVQLYQLPMNAPSRVEAVSFSIDYGNLEPAGEVYAIQLTAMNGDVLDTIATPVIDASDKQEFKLFLSWSRRGNDTANEALVIAGPYNEVSFFGFVNMQLPDLVMQPGGLINLLCFRNISGEEPAIQVLDGIVTLTPNAGAVSSSTALDLTPYLLPAAVG